METIQGHRTENPEHRIRTNDDGRGGHLRG